MSHSWSYAVCGEGSGTHSSTLAWKIPWTEEPGRLRPWCREESDSTEWLHFHFNALEKEMATHSSVLAWRIPGAMEPAGLPSMGSHRIRHDWSDLAAAAAAAAFSNGLISLKFPPCLLCDLTANFFFFFTAESTWGSKSHMARKWQNHTLNLALVES